MLEEQTTGNATIVALMEVDPSVVQMYGIATIEATEGTDVVRITGLVEKPAAGTGAIELRRSSAVTFFGRRFSTSSSTRRPARAARSS